MNNRIVRSSTRLARFEQGEKSDYYKDKILFFDEVMDFPNAITNNDGLEYIKAPYGYVRKDLREDNDVLRGNYPLSIPSDCIWKCDYPSLKHIYKMRNKFSHANPELRDGIEMLANQIEAQLPILGKYIRHDLARTQEGVQPTHCMDTVTISKEYLKSLERADNK